MSEKRFEVENERTVYDNLLHRGFVCSWKVDAQELVGLLNSLVDENRELRQTVTHLEEECGARENDIVNLKKENEQLKKRNKFLEEFDGQAETVVNLKAENERLREILNELEEAIEKRGYDSIDEFW